MGAPLGPWGSSQGGSRPKLLGQLVVIRPLEDVENRCRFWRSSWPHFGVVLALLGVAFWPLEWLWVGLSWSRSRLRNDFLMKMLCFTKYYDFQCFWWFFASAWTPKSGQERSKRRPWASWIVFFCFGFVASFLDCFWIGLGLVFGAQMPPIGWLQPDLAVNGKRRIQTLKGIFNTYYSAFNR